MYKIVVKQNNRVISVISQLFNSKLNAKVCAKAFKKQNPHLTFSIIEV